MTAIIATINSVSAHGDNLTIVTVDNGMEVVANRKEDGSFRWRAGEPVIYVSEGSIVPDGVLKERGYWDDEKDKGLLEGKKGNRVKMRRFAGVESRGLLFKVVEGIGPVEGNLVVENSDHNIIANIGDDVTEFLGITEHVAA